MTAINTDYIQRCLESLELAYENLTRLQSQERMYDVFRAACIKEFELILEQSGKLLKRKLRPYLASKRELDQLNFKDIFRRSAKHGLLDTEEVERWLVYRDSRNETAHEYGEDLAEKTLVLIPGFINDAKMLIARIRESND